MRAFHLTLLLFLSWSSSSLYAKAAVFVPRSWMNVEELLQAVRNQTHIPHKVLVPDTMGKMVLYDNLTDAEGVREAVWEYYVYVLGQMVRWDQDGHEWILRRHWDLDLPVSMDLPALEEAWSEKKRELLELRAQLPLAAIPSAESLLPFDVTETPSSPPLEDLPPWEDGWQGAPEMDEVGYSWWQRMLGVLGLIWETSDHDTRANLRRQWKLDLSMGRVPLIGFVMGGKVDFEMGGKKPKTSATFSMSPAEGSILSSSSSLSQNNNSKLNDQVVQTVIPEANVRSMGKGPRWPRKILSFSTKSWWAMLLEKRSKPEPEPVEKPLSPRVLERRDQAEKWFDAARLNYEQMREQGMSRRER